jgi:hypothetical protein
MPLAAVLAAIQLAQAIADVGKQLNGPRSVIIEVDNNSSETINRISDHHDHGGYAVTPSSTIPAKMADVFGSQSRGHSIATGTEGDIVYAGDGFHLRVYWDNPFIGNNSGSVTLSGFKASRYRVVSTIGAGDTDAHMRYELFELPGQWQPPVTAQGDTMHPGEVLRPGEALISTSGRYRFVYQGDGNLVLYDGNKPLWGTPTWNNVGICQMGTDGNLVIYGSDLQPIWSSDTWQHPNSKLVVQSDGNVVIYDSNGVSVWSTNTWQG